MNPQQPIGIFDSGIGGLTVASAIREILPNEKLVYFGDTKHMPYGEKSPEDIKYWSLKIGEFLKDEGCKVVIMACNTASALAFEALNKTFVNAPYILNVIDPVVKFTAQQEKYTNVGVIATNATIKANIYANKLHKFKPDLKISSLATPLLASMIEKGFFENNINNDIIKTYLSSPELKDIDALILGCTHYPLIYNEINAFFQKDVNVLNTALIVANDVKSRLEKLNLISENIDKEEDEFYVSDLTPSFEKSAKMFFGDKIKLVQKNIWAK